MARRSSEERIQDLEARTAKLKADSERRLSVASDGACELMWECEKALRALGAYFGTDGAADIAAADALARRREAHWAKMKAIREKAVGA